MEDLFLNFVHTPWIGDWVLHLQSAAEIEPWYFAYYHLNYARYLPVYIYEMLAVLDTHTSVTASCCWGFCNLATKLVPLQSDINGPDN